MDVRFMEIAIEEAIDGMEKGAGGPFGAVIVKGHRIIATSHDMVTRTNDPTAHAEMNVIRIASKLLERNDLSDCVIYTSSEPCPMCLSAAMCAGISRIYYGCNVRDAKNFGFADEFLYDYLRNPEAYKEALHTKCLLRDEALVAFKKWEEKQGALLNG